MNYLIAKALVVAAAFSLSACADSGFAPTEGGMRHSNSSNGPSNPNGGYQDTNPDNNVVRNDGSPIISEGQLTDVNNDTGETTTVTTGTVTTGTVAIGANEVGPPTTNDTDPTTAPGKITSPVSSAVAPTATPTAAPVSTSAPTPTAAPVTNDDDSGNDVSFGAERS